MMNATVSRYKWSYFDSYDEDVDLRLFWVFMLWRIQHHRSINQLIDETATAFPDILHRVPSFEYTTIERTLGHIIDIRFITRFLEYWGFVKAETQRYSDREEIRTVDLQPLFMQTFRFENL